MKCNKCKVNDAAIFVGYLNNSRNETVCLCEECSIVAGINLPVLNSELYCSDSSDKDELTADYDLKCPVCGTDIKDFLSSGQIGCSHCYHIFEQEIDRFFKIGSIDINVTPAIGHLTMELQIAIGKENYEYAATLRDKIKVLSSGEVNELIEH